MRREFIYSFHGVYSKNDKLFPFFLVIIVIMVSLCVVLAYFFAPVVNALEARKVPRWIGALAVMFGFLIIVALLVVLILPMISSQIGALINAVPRVHRDEARVRTLPGEPPDASRVPPGCRFHPRCPLCEERCRTEVPSLSPASDDPGVLVACHLRSVSTAEAIAPEEVRP